MEPQTQTPWVREFDRRLEGGQKGPVRPLTVVLTAGGGDRETGADHEATQGDTGTPVEPHRGRIVGDGAQFLRIGH